MMNSFTFHWKTGTGRVGPAYALTECCNHVGSAPVVRPLCNSVLKSNWLGSMINSRPFQIAVAFCVAVPGLAQQHPLVHAFDKPSGLAWRCGFVPIASADSAKGTGLVYHFTETKPKSAREIWVYYDWRENPRKVRASVSEHGEDDGTLVTQTEIIWFGGSNPKAAMGVRSNLSGSVPDAFPDSPNAATGWSRTNASENGDARDFALLLRDHVCHKPPPGWRSRH